MSVDSLQLQIDQLQQQLTALAQTVGGSEVLEPNYLTVDPAGNVGANFTGTINALGLILPAGVSPSTTAQNQVRWQRQSDGALTALLEAYHSSSTIPASDWLHLSVGGPATASPASDVLIEARSAGNVAAGQLTVSQNAAVGQITAYAGGAGGAIAANANGNYVTIIDSNNASMFVQGNSPANIGYAGSPQNYQTGRFFQASQVSNAVLASTNWLRSIYTNPFGAANDGDFNPSTGIYTTPALGVYLFWHHCGINTPTGTGQIPEVAAGIGNASGVSFVGTISFAPNGTAVWGIDAFCLALWNLGPGNQVAPWIFTNAGGTILATPYSYFGGARLL
jgi:hypothetical protein